jgi:hypothetical protein
LILQLKRVYLSPTFFQWKDTCTKARGCWNTLSEVQLRQNMPRRVIEGHVSPNSIWEKDCDIIIVCSLSLYIYTHTHKLQRMPSWRQTLYTCIMYDPPLTNNMTLTNTFFQITSYPSRSNELTRIERHLVAH